MLGEILIEETGKTLGVRVLNCEPGAVTMKVREALLGIQQGTAPDPHGWMQRVV